MIAQMWQVYLDHIQHMRKNRVLTPFDVAQMLAMVKTARSVYGTSPDNPVDQAGYSALSAMLHPLYQLNEDGSETKELKDDGTIQDEGSARSS
jgi:hypothetical protein